MGDILYIRIYPKMPDFNLLHSIYVRNNVCRLWNFWKDVMSKVHVRSMSRNESGQIRNNNFCVSFFEYNSKYSWFWVIGCFLKYRISIPLICDKVGIFKLWYTIMSKVQQRQKNNVRLWSNFLSKRKFESSCLPCSWIEFYVMELILKEFVLSLNYQH